MKYDLLLRSRRVVLPDGVRPGAVAVADGRIAAVLEHTARPGSAALVELGDDALLPGLVDTHVHVNEPGRTEWEGFATATRAAAAGGVTTIIDMPLNSLPPTLDPAALSAKQAAATGQIHTDVGFWGGAVPGNLGRLRDLWDAGVYGFKCFTADSGVPEFPPVSSEQLKAVLDEVAGFDGLVLVHAESSDGLRPLESAETFAEFLASRPALAEQRAITRLIEAVRATGGRAHVLHLSAARALSDISAARAEGVRISVETCPHYLTLTAEEIPDGATEFKCCPPIRNLANRESLWAGLSSGDIDCVVSDHSPCPPAMKSGDFASAWGGIASLQLGLPLVWTAARARGFSLPAVVDWMAARPAALAGVSRKGRIAVGFDADLVAFDPDGTFTVDPASLRHRHPVTPYAGQRLTGVVRRTWLRGRNVGGEPLGRLLRRETP